MKTVLILCTGNSCRSQMAEVLVNHDLAGQVRALSAGTRPQPKVADGAIAVWSWPAEHTARLPDLMHRYTRLPMDLADASLVLLAEHLGHGRILTTDQRDFGAYRFKSREPFDNLLLRAAHD